MMRKIAMSKLTNWAKIAVARGPAPAPDAHLEHVDVPIATPRVSSVARLTPLVALDHSVAQCDHPRHAVGQGWVVRHNDDGRSALRVDREK
jgi:hypothetical protein